MTQLEALEQQLYDERIPVYCQDFKKARAKGLYINGKIFLSLEVENITEKRCILAEEYCHHCFNYGNVLCDKKQEALARRKSYEMLVPLHRLKAAKRAGCSEIYEIADYLEVTEDVLISALDHYRSKEVI